MKMMKEISVEYGYSWIHMLDKNIKYIPCTCIQSCVLYTNLEYKSIVLSIEILFFPTR